MPVFMTTLKECECGSLCVTLCVFVCLCARARVKRGGEGIRERERLLMLNASFQIALNQSQMLQSLTSKSSLLFCVIFFWFLTCIFCRYVEPDVTIFFCLHQPTPNTREGNEPKNVRWYVKVHALTIDSTEPRFRKLIQYNHYCFEQRVQIDIDSCLH